MARTKPRTEFWRDQNNWFRQKRLYAVPIVTRNFTDSIEYEGNIYTKGGWVLKMLRTKLGDEDFLPRVASLSGGESQSERGDRDLVKAIDQSTTTNVDHFFHQWIYERARRNLSALQL